MSVVGIGAIVDHRRDAAGGSLPGVDAEFDDRCAADGLAIDRTKVGRSPLHLLPSINWLTTNYLYDA
jgi:hypothetical protein